MSAQKFSLTSLSLSHGVWESVLDVAGGAEPELHAYAGDVQIDPPEVSALDNGALAVRLALPASVLNDGMQVVSIVCANDGDVLATCPIIAGETLTEEPLAEIRLLRAELDMLKRAFRHYCREHS